MAEVRLKGVTKVYPGGIKAVQNVDLKIHDREFIVLVGPSGCGKSTTLRMIAGLEEITEGTIEIGERVVNDVPPKDRDIAMVFQNYALYPHMTVYNNMAFGLKLRRFPKDEIDRRVQDAAKILGITELLERKPKALSGGQRQRVAVGRAIVRQPAAFLFDEPLSNLDAKLRVEMRAELNKLHQRLETTMIYVTHDQVEAMTLGDRIVLMKDGFIQQVARPLIIYDQPVNRFVAAFIGTPSMNFFDGRLQQADGGELIWTDGSTNIALPARLSDRLSSYVDKDVTLGVRPEDLYHGEVPSKVREQAVIPATVDVLEPLGAESLVHAKTDRQTFTMRIDGHHSVSVGEQMEVTLDLDAIHLFDNTTDDETQARNLTLDDSVTQPAAVGTEA